MTRAFQPLIPAKPTFTEQGLACSDRYDDLYHSASGAISQANYVFLAGNGLPERWQKKEQFTILETGFGLGNNFLATWDAWRKDPQRSQRLHFVSFEAHPFSAADLALMLQHTTSELQPLVNRLVAQWPVLTPGIHRLEFESGRVTLTLFFGEIERSSKLMQCQADAFYLDGFAPRVNPAMWSPELFGQLVRMSAPGATAATWCSAAQVRRDLQNAGFVVERYPGFAFKRHMIRASLRPHLGRRLPSKPEGPVVIVGGGIAGAATAYALAQRGIASQVLDPIFSLGLGGAHHGHAAVALTPLLTSDDAPRARLSRAGVLLAWQRWAPFLNHSLMPTGALTQCFSTSEAQSLAKTIQELGFDTDWVQYIGAGQRLEPNGIALRYGGAYFSKGLTVYPELLLQQLLSHPLITPVAARVCAVENQHGMWHLTTEQHGEIRTEQVVLANAAGSKSLLASLVPQADRVLSMDELGGQSSVIAAQALTFTSQSILAGQGYVVPVDAARYVVGSTYEAVDAGISLSSHQQIMQKVGELMPLKSAAPALAAWFGQRVALADHFPVVTQALPGLWVNTGYGSYGFSWAAIAADLISTHLAAEPVVLERDLSRALYLR